VHRWWAGPGGSVRTSTVSNIIRRGLVNTAVMV
jgi:hypothetical protein